MYQLIHDMSFELIQTTYKNKSISQSSSTFIKGSTAVLIDYIIARREKYY